MCIRDSLHKYRSAQDKFIVESFGTIAAYGGNAAMMHYHATEEDHAKLERKGFLLVDSGATYLDGTTDITRTYPLGELTEDEKLFYTWTLQCHIDIAKAVWLNYCDGHMLDTIAREPLWQHLINYRCGTGHSVSFVDVYKRQVFRAGASGTEVYSPLLSGKLQRGCDIMEKNHRRTAQKKEAGMMKQRPVSYTHLDVYKRQLQRRPFRFSSRYRCCGFVERTCDFGR